MVGRFGTRTVLSDMKLLQVVKPIDAVGAHWLGRQNEHVDWIGTCRTEAELPEGSDSKEGVSAHLTNWIATEIQPEQVAAVVYDAEHPMVGDLVSGDAQLLQHSLTGCEGVDAVVGDSTPVYISGKGTEVECL